MGAVEGWDGGGRDKKYMGWGQQALLTPIKRRLVQHKAAAGPFESLVPAALIYPLPPNFTASHPLGFSLQEYFLHLGDPLIPLHISLPILTA